MTSAAKRQYASGTTVGIGRSKDEIQAELVRMGALKRLIHEDDEAHRAVVAFERLGIQYRITLPLPDPTLRDFWYTPARSYRRDGEQAREAWVQACMERWRALAAYIKALRVAAEGHITTVERVLAPFAVVPGTNGQTVQEWVEAQLPDAYARGSVPPLLSGTDALRLIEAPGEAP